MSFPRKREYHLRKLLLTKAEVIITGCSTSLILPPLSGAGVIWNGVPYETLVIPAKAGIQSIDSALPKVCGVDSRFRGNDRDFQRPCLANDASTPFRCATRR